MSVPKTSFFFSISGSYLSEIATVFLNSEVMGTTGELREPRHKYIFFASLMLTMGRYARSQ